MIIVMIVMFIMVILTKTWMIGSPLNTLIVNNVNHDDDLYDRDDYVDVDRHHHPNSKH